MDIYNIGEEKCIDSVWGREANGRFYNLIVQEDKLGRFLDIDVNPEKLVQSLAVLMEHSGFTNYNYEEAVNSSVLFYKHYKPKHIKDLENLKRGDVVWFKICTAGRVLWGSTRFVKKIGDRYITTDVFDDDGNVVESFTVSHTTVYLKPPFHV
jgi:hypothetical protein